MLFPIYCVHVLGRARLFATPWIVAHQAPLFMGFSQARILESVAIPFSSGSYQPRDQNCISMSQALGGGFFTTRATWEGSPSKLLSKGSLSCCKHLKKVCVNLLKFLALDNSSLEG